MFWKTVLMGNFQTLRRTEKQFCRFMTPQGNLFKFQFEVKLETFAPLLFPWDHVEDSAWETVGEILFLICQSVLSLSLKCGSKPGNSTSYFGQLLNGLFSVENRRLPLPEFSRNRHVVRLIIHIFAFSEDFKMGCSP